MEEELLNILKDRGVLEDTMQLFIDNKIDCNVLPLKYDDTLKTYLPAYGDRVSAVAFCKVQKSVPSNLHDSGRKGTLERLRMKLSSRATSTTVQFGNSYAKKRHRHIELGWMDFSDKFNSYKQVKTQSGGGVRHMSIEKELSLNEIQEVGTDIFFPKGRNPRGRVEDFNIELKDFQGAALDPQMTVQKAYEHAKLRMLRLYLYAKKKSEGKESCSSTGGTELDLPNICRDKDEDSDLEMGRPIALGNIQQNPSRRRIGRNDDSHRRSQPRDVETASGSAAEAIEVCDSEDEELQTALYASLHPEPSSDASAGVDSDSQDLAQMLEIFQDRFIKSNRTNCVVSRAHPLDSAIRTLEQKTVDLQNTLFLKFSGEVGEDHGGPRR